MPPLTPPSTSKSSASSTPTSSSMASSSMRTTNQIQINIPSQKRREAQRGECEKKRRLKRKEEEEAAEAKKKRHKTQRKSVPICGSKNIMVKKMVPTAYSNGAGNGNGSRKKCKNPDCRCRERKQRKRAHHQKTTGKREKPEKKKEESAESVIILADDKNMANKQLDVGRDYWKEEEDMKEQKDIGHKSELIVREDEEEEEQQRIKAAVALMDPQQQQKAEAAINFSCFPDVQSGMFIECFGCSFDPSSSAVDNKNYCLPNGMEVLRRLPKLAKMSDEQLSMVGQKRVQLEKNYKLNCSTVGLVIRKLLLKDPALKESLKHPLMAVLRDFEQETWAEMDDFIGIIAT